MDIAHNCWVTDTFLTLFNNQQAFDGSILFFLIFMT